MRLSQSVSRKLVATAVTAVGFVVLYEATMFDSKFATRTVLDKEHEIEPTVGPSMEFTAKRGPQGLDDRVGRGPARRRCRGRRAPAARRVRDPDPRG